MKIRDVFFKEIYQLTKSGEDIVIVVSDIGAPGLDEFRRDFPNRFINVGIAEQNLLAVSSGLQLAGKKVIAYGLNPFPVTRAFDQIRNIMASLQIPITVTSLNAGTCSADAGYTHMPIENIALLRTLKNIHIVNPSDATIVKRFVTEMIAQPKPRYVQFDKFIEDQLYDAEDVDFGTGYITNRRKSDLVVISSGIIAHRLMKKNFPVKIIDIFSIPIAEEKFINDINSCKKIVTIEDGVLNGGIGSMILEILNKFGKNIPVERLGLKFEKGYPDVYTNREMILEEEGLSDKKIEQYLCEMSG